MIMKPMISDQPFTLVSMADFLRLEQKSVSVFCLAPQVLLHTTRGNRSKIPGTEFGYANRLRYHSAGRPSHLESHLGDGLRARRSSINWVVHLAAWSTGRQIPCTGSERISTGTSSVALRGECFPAGVSRWLCRQSDRASRAVRESNPPRRTQETGPRRKGNPPGI